MATYDPYTYIWNQKVGLDPNYYDNKINKTPEMMAMEDIQYVQKLIHHRLDQVDHMYKKMCELYDVVMLALVKNIEDQHEKEIQQEQ